jgi:hypothetical protein
LTEQFTWKKKIEKTGRKEVSKDEQRKKRQKNIEEIEKVMNCLEMRPFVVIYFYDIVSICEMSTGPQKTQRARGGNGRNGETAC